MRVKGATHYGTKVCQRLASGGVVRPMFRGSDSSMIDRWMPEYPGDEKAKTRVVPPALAQTAKNLKKKGVKS